MVTLESLSEIPTINGHLKSFFLIPRSTEKFCWFFFPPLPFTTEYGNEAFSWTLSIIITNHLLLLGATFVDVPSF